ncbi:ATP-binding cassette domain-containing protein [Actinopolymorpha pittospori]|uniref:ABC-2 type transport system ATP-binding protein n=1 Tax=Actinopolymorpha pittospori TaxID=648752 RepID=A0A927MS65_9ACTN|nr:ATP-binding cassette domain-containing protein [Actinopolymorpha pittospori]MBE1605886.1 ABC-2 type transport system ATP-binding protein [Actinopolymorpha pittospori]
MIVVRELTKRYGPTLAVDQLSFEVRPGVVTGFLGPNGAGKSTTLRILLGLHHPTSGEALIGNRRYDRIGRPMHEVGAVLDADAAHPGRTAFHHLACLARSNGIGKARVTAVLERVGLASVAHKRVGGFSLGMRQRLGIAGALLGDPAVILLDEPVNGLDAAGIRWIRSTLRSLAAEGRTVLLSSHLMSEMALTVDHVLIIGRGRLLEETSMTRMRDRFERDVLVRSPQAAELAGILAGLGASVTATDDGGLVAVGVDASAIGDAAAAASIPLHELTSRSATLEDVYLDLTSEVADYQAAVERTARP